MIKNIIQFLKTKFYYFTIAVCSKQTWSPMGEEGYGAGAKQAQSKGARTGRGLPNTSWVRGSKLLVKAAPRVGQATSRESAFKAQKRLFCKSLRETAVSHLPPAATELRKLEQGRSQAKFTSEVARSLPGLQKNRRKVKKPVPTAQSPGCGSHQGPSTRTTRAGEVNNSQKNNNIFHFVFIKCQAHSV